MSGAFSPIRCPAVEMQSWYRRVVHTWPVNAPEKSGEAPLCRVMGKTVPVDKPPAACHQWPGRASLPCKEPRSHEVFVWARQQSLSSLASAHVRQQRRLVPPTRPRGLLAPWLMRVGSQCSVTPAIKKRTIGPYKAEEHTCPVQKPSLPAGFVTQVRSLSEKEKGPAP